MIFSDSTSPTVDTTGGGTPMNMGITTSPAGLATRDQVLDAYKTTPGAIANPDESAINYWMNSGLNGFAGTVAAVNAKNAANNTGATTNSNVATNGNGQLNMPLTVTNPYVAPAITPAHENTNTTNVTSVPLSGSYTGQMTGPPTYTQMNRPSQGSQQAYQDIYRPQYQNYNNGNPMGVSQYGRQQPFGMTNQSAMQMQNPFMSQRPVSAFGGQMTGGGYGQFGNNNPYSPQSNSFMNMPQNFGQMGQMGQADQYNQLRSQGFNDQGIRNAATGMGAQQSNSDFQNMQRLGFNMMNPALNSASPQFMGPQAPGSASQQQQQAQQQYMNPYMSAMQRQMYPSSSQQQNPFAMQQQKLGGINEGFRNQQTPNFGMSELQRSQGMVSGESPTSGVYNQKGSGQSFGDAMRSLFSGFGGQQPNQQQPINRGNQMQPTYAEGGITSLLESK